MELEAGEVVLGKLTSSEFKSRLGDGGLHSVIIAVGATEQHLDHLAMEHDVAMAQYVAIHAAQKIFPAAVVVVPTTLGLSEHHMASAGTLSSTPGAWFGIVHDTIASLVRAGLNNILILNGHAGNEAPVEGVLWQWQLEFRQVSPSVNLQFESYWNLCRSFSEQHCEGSIPGHGQEYETATGLYALSENVRLSHKQASNEEGVKRATYAAGEKMVQAAIQATADYLLAMNDDPHRIILTPSPSRDRHHTRQDALRKAKGALLAT